MKLDRIDKSILHVLDLNARASYQELGEISKCSKETAANRVKRLHSRGIISSFSTIINFSKLGHTAYGVFCELKNTDKSTYKKIIQGLSQNPDIYWLATVCGKYDLIIGISAKNVIEFDEIYSKIQEKYSNYLKHSDIATRVDVTRFRKNYLRKKDLKNSDLFFGRKIENELIDETDKKIISLLTENSRIQTTDLARSLNLPRSTVHSRIKNLENRKIIQGYTSLIHPVKYNFQTYHLLISVNSKNKERLDEFNKYCKKNPNILYFIRTVGKWDFELTCDLENQLALQDLLLSIREEFSDYIDAIDDIPVFNYFEKYAFSPNSTGAN